MRAALRILSTALITAGLVLLVDAGVTLAWQEPLSAVRAGLQQGSASRTLEKAGNAYSLRPDQLDDASVRRAAHRYEKTLTEGDPMGRIKIPRAGLDRVLFYGIELSTLDKGPGHYDSTSMPGTAGITGIAGHRTTWGAPFRRIDKLGKGDEVTVETPYATFRYRYVSTRVVVPTQTDVVKSKSKRKRLVLTACHPPYSAAKRLVVTLEQVGAEPPAKGG